MFKWSVYHSKVFNQTDLSWKLSHLSVFSRSLEIQIRTDYLPPGNKDSTIITAVAIKVSTVNFLNIRTPKKFVVITLKFELCGSTIE